LARCKGVFDGCSLAAIISSQSLTIGRLIEAIECDERTPRAISLAAGLDPNYLGQMIERGTAPSTPALVSLCDTLRVSLTHIFTGSAVTPAARTSRESFRP